MATRETAASPRLELASGGPTSASDYWRPAKEELPCQGCAAMTSGSRGGKPPHPRDSNSRRRLFSGIPSLSAEHELLHRSRD